MASCKKESTNKTNNTVTTPAVPIATLGLYEVQSSIYRRVYIGVAVGTSKTVFYSVFDTGSSAMTLQADSTFIPKSMFNDNGFIIPNDSLNVNGITITKQTATLAYGDNTSGTKEFGNLAYAKVTIGDENGSVTTKRIPFFLYYKAIDTQTGKALDPHENDVFGVGPYNKFQNLSIASPLSYFDLPANVTQGFKLSKFVQTSYSGNGTYVRDLLTIGLVPDDLSSKSGFVMHPLTLTTSGYSPNLPASITYGGKTIQGLLLFDTGTPAFSNIEDPTAAANTTTLPNNSVVTITTNSGFSYTYTVVNTQAASHNLTQIEKPSFTGDTRTIFSIDFFNDNQFLLDYTNHKIGLKN
ncbi:hypothetical protein KXD93_24865 [Mucilaginibacter sp. BJC16-A38]|uniref:hypothetical protein n=1 Tax=Mucilaginibacter phenanthrenivorans TaxID=1234842 RepID=UPI0021578A6B|nr:hypothetical protein [Mucilaginibacter phenanthrenivorans]MCR8560913.1 hypothetical protein [Mucilaginibacter phenanthrenivorans]